MPRRLQFRGEYSPSIVAKIFIISWYALAVIAAVRVSLGASGGAAASGRPERQAILLACALLYVARAAVTLFVFLKRRVPWWEATPGGGLIGFVLFAFLSEGFRSPQSLGLVDGVGVLLYAAGSYMGSASERSRHAWKSRPGNRGHLYTEGLFRYSRHINYFADLLVFGGFALLTRQPWAGLVPLTMGLSFVFFLIPAHDAYLESRYGAEFDAYAGRTKKLIPFVY